MNKIILKIVVALCLLILCGCGLRISKTNPAQQVKQGKFQLYDPNDCSFTAIYHKDPNSNDPNSWKINLSWKNSTIEPNEPVSASYRFFEFAFGSHPVVNGKLSNGKSVTVMVDTGCEYPMLAWDTTIRSRGIPELPFSSKDGGLGGGDIPELMIYNGKSFDFPSQENHD